VTPDPLNTKSRTQTYLSFVLLSGAGWLCDFSTFTVLVTLLDCSPFSANFASSFVGVTFVWLMSLQVVFGRSRSSSGRFLLIYWGFQIVSILLYSRAIQWGASWMIVLSTVPWLTSHVAITTKVLVTPLNLATNFIFMRWLTCFMLPSIK
jgi:putative flippase GtrA